MWLVGGVVLVVPAPRRRGRRCGRSAGRRCRRSRASIRNSRRVEPAVRALGRGRRSGAADPDSIDVALIRCSSGNSHDTLPGAGGDGLPDRLGRRRAARPRGGSRTPWPCVTAPWVGRGSVMLGCRATTSRCSRPPSALPSWYLRDQRPRPRRRARRAKAARSAAEAKRISLSIAKVATGLRAAAAPAISSPTSRTSRAASASIQRADTWSGEPGGIGRDRREARPARSRRRRRWRAARARCSCPCGAPPPARPARGAPARAGGSWPAAARRRPWPPACVAEPGSASAASSRARMGSSEASAAAGSSMTATSSTQRRVPPKAFSVKKR